MFYKTAMQLNAICRFAKFMGNKGNIFINDLSLRVTKSGLHNFADNNSIAVTCKNLNDLLRTLKKNQKQR